MLQVDTNLLHSSGPSIEIQFSGIIKPEDASSAPVGVIRVKRGVTKRQYTTVQFTFGVSCWWPKSLQGPISKDPSERNANFWEHRTTEKYYLLLSGRVLESAETPPWAESLQGVISKDPSVRNANFLAPNNGEDMQFRFEHAQFTFSEKFDRSHTKTWYKSLTLWC